MARYSFGHSTTVQRLRERVPSHGCHRALQYPYARQNSVVCRGAQARCAQPVPDLSLEAVVTTVTRAIPRPVRCTTALLTTALVLVVLSFPLASGLQVRPASGALPPHGLASAVDTPEDGESSKSTQTSGEHVDPVDRITTTLPSQVCDQRSAVHLPDAVPSGALRLVVWDQPWWPLPPVPFDLVPEQTDAGELPQTRGPPLPAPTTV